MPDFGLTSTGFEPMIQQDLLDAIEVDQHATVSAGLDVSLNSPDGMRNSVSARQAALVWELLTAIYDGLDPDKAENDQLVNVCKLTGTTPAEATFGTVPAQCLMSSGTELLADEHFANVPGRSELWTPDADFTAPADGVHGVLFRCTTAGAVPANATTLTQINAGPAGWTSVTNALDATQGQAADTNETLRARRERDLARAGSATARAIVSDMLALKDSTGRLLIQSCGVLENDTDVTDSNGVPPHSLETVISDTPAVADTVIAAALMGTKAGGVGTAGSVLSSATDEFGTTHPIRFSRPTDVPIYIAYEIKAGPEFDALVFKAAVVEQLAATHAVGASVLVWDAEVAAKQSNVLNLVSDPRLGTVSTGLATSTDILLPPRSRPVFDTSRVEVTVVP